MATYATYAQMVRRYGTAALTALIPTDSGSDLETLTGDARVEAAAEIDACLGAAGYATPVDTSAITDADQQARSAAMLRRIEIGLAVAILGREHAAFSLSTVAGGMNAKSMKDGQESIAFNVGGDGASSMRADAKRARELLDMICARHSGLPGITIPGRTFVYSSEAAVPDADDVSDRLAVAGGW